MSCFSYQKNETYRNNLQKPIEKLYWVKVSNQLKLANRLYFCFLLYTYRQLILPSLVYIRTFSFVFTIWNKRIVNIRNPFFRTEEEERWCVDSQVPNAVNNSRIETKRNKKREGKRWGFVVPVPNPVSFSGFQFPAYGSHSQCSETCSHKAPSISSVQSL